MFIRILNSEMELATGCTEPGAVALTAAEAGQALRKAGVDKAEEITVNASINIIKNAMSAGIPGTDYEGMDYAAAIGALGGDPVYLLEVMNHVPRETVEAAAALVKAGKVKEIADMRDETDLSGLKLAIDLKRGVDPDKLMAKLYRLTPLQDTVSCNFNILIAGMPRVLGVGGILEEWTAWRTDCVKRRVYFILNKKKEKLHLLQGLKRILLDIDKAIRMLSPEELEQQAKG